MLPSLLSYPLDIRRAGRLLAISEPHDTNTNERAPITLQMLSERLLIGRGRYLATFAHAAQVLNRRLIIRCPKQQLAHIARTTFGRIALANTATVWQSDRSPITNQGLLLTDSPVDQTNPESPIATELLVGRDAIAKTLAMPFPMHPNVQPYATDELLSQLRFTVSRTGIFLAGCETGKTRADIGKQPQKELLCHEQVVRTIHDHFGDRIARALHSDGHHVPILIGDARDSSLGSEDWLRRLAQCDFLLCPPAARQCFNHHLVEAMSVGTIPIVEYGRRLSPALQNGLNAIYFEGADGLCDAIRRVDRLSPPEVAALRGNVVNYYEKHMRIDHFLDLLGQNRRDIPIVSLPFHDRNLFDEGRFTKAAA